MFVDPNSAPQPTGVFGSYEEATRYLERACALMDVNHLAYTLLRSVDGAPELAAWVATYDPAYMSYYMENHTQLGDPAFETAFTHNAVIDWAELHDPRSRIAGIIGHVGKIRNHQVWRFHSGDGR